jgi:hypothetical protein
VRRASKQRQRTHIVVLDVDGLGDLVDRVQANLHGLQVGHHDLARVHAAVQEGLGLLKELAGCAGAGARPSGAGRAARARGHAPMTMTDVVPSPTSSSCVRLSSIIDLAAGCDTSISRRMALPSLVCAHARTHARMQASVPRARRTPATNHRDAAHGVEDHLEHGPRAQRGADDVRDDLRGAAARERHWPMCVRELVCAKPWPRRCCRAAPCGQSRAWCSGLRRAHAKTRARAAAGEGGARRPAGAH